MSEQNRYGVKVRLCRVGHLASVSKETLIAPPGMEPWWMGWSPEPSYWRPTEAWAIRRAQRKRLRLERADTRRMEERRMTVETRETFHVSVAACIAAVLLPFAGCQAVKEYRQPDRVKACVAGGGTWSQAYIKDKPTDQFACFPPVDPK